MKEIKLKKIIFKKTKKDTLHSFLCAKVSNVCSHALCFAKAAELCY